MDKGQQEADMTDTQTERLYHLYRIQYAKDGSEIGRSLVGNGHWHPMTHKEACKARSTFSLGRGWAMILVETDGVRD